jgi:hypothetical protein
VNAEPTGLMASSPPGPLPARIARTVAAAPGGGLHRYELAQRVGLADSDRVFTRALLACYGRRLVDFCGWQWVVAPASSKGGTRESPSRM